MCGDDDEENRRLKQPEGDEKWEDVIPVNGVFTVELNVNFRGAEIRSTEQLRYRMDGLFPQISFKDICVTKPRSFHVYQVVLDTENLVELVNHPNYGMFEGDYTVKVLSYMFNKTNDGTVEEIVDSPMKSFTGFKARVGEEKELVIVMRRGPNPTDAPARGMQTFRIFSELTEVTRVLDHFNLLGKVTRVSQATPSIPTLAVALKMPVEFLQANGELVNVEPMRVYNPSPQSIESGHSELWAHLRLDQKTKRIVIEGINGRANMQEVRHKLTFHGELKGGIAPTIWTADENEALAGVEKGDVAVSIDLEYEINYLIMGRTAFRVSYQGQAMQCHYCFSWDHTGRNCWRKNERRDDLLRSYHEKWKRQMGYQKKEDLDESQIAPKNIDLTGLKGPAEEDKSAEEDSGNEDGAVPKKQAENDATVNDDDGEVAVLETGVDKEAGKADAVEEGSGRNEEEEVVDADKTSAEEEVVDEDLTMAEEEASSGGDLGDGSKVKGKAAKVGKLSNVATAKFGSVIARSTKKDLELILDNKKKDEENAKRKASPLSKDEKKTGSGRKIDAQDARRKDQDEERRESRDLVILNTFQSECDKMVKRLTKANAKDKAKIRVDAEAKFEKVKKDLKNNDAAIGQCTLDYNKVEKKLGIKPNSDKPGDQATTANEKFERAKQDVKSNEAALEQCELESNKLEKRLGIKSNTEKVDDLAEANDNGK